MYTLIGLSVLLLVFVLVNRLTWLQDFFKELHYLESEIDRTSGSEREQWKHRKKRHMKSLIPFYRYFKR